MNSITEKLYRPSSHAEAVGFFKLFCDRCERGRPPNSCEVFTRALLEEPVPEWHYDTTSNKPTCSAFQEGENHFRDDITYAIDIKGG